MCVLNSDTNVIYSYWIHLHFQKAQVQFHLFCNLQVPGIPNWTNWWRSLSTNTSSSQTLQTYVKLWRGAISSIDSKSSKCDMILNNITLPQLSTVTAVTFSREQNRVTLITGMRLCILFHFLRQKWKNWGDDP